MAKERLKKWRHASLLREPVTEVSVQQDLRMIDDVSDGAPPMTSDVDQHSSQNEKGLPGWCISCEQHPQRFCACDAV